MFLLFDIGGTKTRLAVSTDHKKLDKTKIFPTPSSFDEGIAEIKKVGLQLAGKNKFLLGAGSVATPIDKAKTKVINDSEKQTFTAWINKPLKESLKKSFGIPIFLENDSAMGGLGEAVFGSGKNHKIVMYMTVSTGVGGARITSGKIDNNALGFEPGWQVINMCGSKNPGPKEPLFLLGFIDGNHIRRRTGKPPQEIDDEIFWNDIAHHLAYGVHNSICHWSPNIVVLGGSIMRKCPIEKVIEYISEIPSPYSKLPEIKLGTLGDECGLYGALHYLNNIKS